MTAINCAAASGCYLFTELFRRLPRSLHRKIQRPDQVSRHEPAHQRCIPPDLPRCSCGNCQTGRTFATRIPIHRVFTVDRFCKYFCHSGLTCTSGSTEQIRMSYTIRVDLILQCCHYMVLPLHIRKLRRTELPV